jgi:cytochrome c oxidase subunit III
MAAMAQAAIASAERRPGTPLLFAVVLFLASELLFFGGLFAAYFALRAQTEPWPPADAELDIALATIGTLLLAGSSATMQAGVAGARNGRIPTLRRWTAATIGLGAAFLAIQLYDWVHLDFTVSSHAYGTIFYALTGFHGLHVVAGLLLMLVMLGRAAQGAYRVGHAESAEAAAYYWHFVDAVWIALYATLFLLR